MHTLAISAHALAGAIALVFACILMRVPSSTRSLRFVVYYGAIVALVGFVALAVAIDWPDLAVVQRVVYPALIALGAYTLLRAEQARRALSRRPNGWRFRYLDHVGFTVISLFDGFVIVAAIDLGAPGILVGVIAVLGVVAGIVSINALKRRMRVQAT